jgi:hypothetical protein
MLPGTDAFTTTSATVLSGKTCHLCGSESISSSGEHPPRGFSYHSHAP